MKNLWLLLACIAFAFPAQAQTYSIATGSPSGIYYPFGGGLAALWSDHSERINMKAEVTNGSVTNLIQVAKGESEAGISQADAFYAAREGRGKFPEALPVSVLFALYPNLVHLIVPADSDIRTVADLRGRRVSIGAPGSGNMVTAKNILSALGIPLDALDVYHLSYTETAYALKDGGIDAGFIVGGIGVAVVTELALTRPIRLIAFSDTDIAALHAAFPAYAAFSVPEGLYAGMEEPVQTVSLWNFLVVNRSLPDPLAYELTRIAFEQNAALRAIAYPAKFTTAENTRRYAWEFLHPGAKAYFEGRTP